MRQHTNKWAQEHYIAGKTYPLPEIVPAPPAKKLYKSPVKKLTPSEPDDMDITEKGAYLVEWASLAKDLTALFLEGVGLVILGHFITVAGIMMLVGLLTGFYALRHRARKNRR